MMHGQRNIKLVLLVTKTQRLPVTWVV